ncbi:activator of Hsp90 ATPase-like protein [Diaminobutyricimonas aerilata]|uniref:Activator of Hsp90 ATPase-like protein n=1 Tax=Diaminobutyricimonas aerilata TaxID=1162967 RepID=A0A2M9CIF8_9MICO|nr:SRPBCC domain-containing protein [Diaminobutyricimonas aerilata]PJJ71703.1 activator of Hsp90 ATPase-like protein [Diaminobutyricimonas aerilata]
MTLGSPPKRDADFALEVEVERAPAEVFAAIHDVSAWWITAVGGANAEVGDEFWVEKSGVHTCRLRVAQLVADRRIVWRVVRSTRPSLADSEEWVGTDLTFELFPAADGTRLRFTHVGLSPLDEGYDVSAREWERHLGGRLADLLALRAGTSEGER